MRSGGAEDQRIGGAEDWRRGGVKERRIGGVVELERRGEGVGSDDGRRGGGVGGVGGAVLPTLYVPLRFTSYPILKWNYNREGKAISNLLIWFYPSELYSVAFVLKNVFS